MKQAIGAVVIGFVLAVVATTIGARWMNPSPTPHVITVTGESRLIGEPDEARVMFGVEHPGKTVAEGKKRTWEDINRVIAAVQAAGVEKRDVATSDVDIRPVWDSVNNVVKGYRVATTLTITVRDVQQVGRVVDSATASGMNRLQGVSYDVVSPKWRQKAMRGALSDAREKAEAMAAGVGCHLGRVVAVRQLGAWETSPAQEYYWGGARMSYDKVAEPGFSPLRALPGQRAMTVRVEVVYQI